MGQYVLTGGATGIGAAIKQSLLSRGDSVYVIDIRDADLLADLSTPEGCLDAAQTVSQNFPQGIDGFIPCAGLGPNISPASLIVKVNFFAARFLVEAFQPLLARKQGSVVVISSNSAAMGTNSDLVEAMLQGDEARAAELAESFPTGQEAYGASKLALTRWMRKASTEFAAQGIRLNAVAPGIIKTALTDNVLADEQLGPLIKAFGETVPIGGIGLPEQIADIVVFLLSPSASFICGSVIFADGGHDAMLRPDDF